MSERISLEEFSDFVEPTVRESCTWGEIPSWLAPYWRRGQSVEEDHAALLVDLDAKATRAEEFIARFVAWKLKK